jgi:hypothetical protein
MTAGFARGRPHFTARLAVAAGDPGPWAAL